MVPYIPLLTKIVTIAKSYCTAVASSWPVMRKSPSPAMATAIRLGCTIFAAIAAGKPEPIDQLVGPSNVPKRRN